MGVAQFAYRIGGVYPNAISRAHHDSYLTTPYFIADQRILAALSFTALESGHWVGASVHDVGQVVATAWIAVPAASAVTIVVKLTGVLMLAPMSAVTPFVVRRSGGTRAARPGLPGQAFR